MIPLALVEIPIDQSLESSPVITSVIIISFILSSLAIAFGKRTLLQKMKNFFVTRERNSLFDTSTNIDWWVSLVFVLQCGVMFSVCMLSYFNQTLSYDLPYFKVLLMYSLVTIGYIMLKFIFYRFVGWIFFDNASTSLLIDSYKTILFYNSFALFILAIVSVYFNLSISVLQIVLLLLIVVDKILSFYKWFRLFFNIKVGYVLFFSQFCTLEIIPCFVVYKSFIEINILFK